MKIWKKFAGKSKQKSSLTLSVYYTRIDELTMDRYRLAIEQNDLTQLRRSSVGTKRLDEKAMEAIEQSFIDEMGVNDKFAALQRVKDQLARLELEYIETDRRVLWNNIRQKREQVRTMESKMQGGLNIMQAKNILDKWLATVIKLNEITVLDFYTKLKEYERNS